MDCGLTFCLVDRIQSVFRQMGCGLIFLCIVDRIQRVFRQMNCRLFVPAGKSRFEAECKDLKKYPLDEQDQCYCSQLQPIVIGGWSDCVLEERKDIKQR